MLIAELCLFPQPVPNALLPPIKLCDSGKKCMVIDLDETLVHSSFKVSLSRIQHDASDLTLLRLVVYFS